MPDIINDCVLIQYADDTQFLAINLVGNFLNVLRKTQKPLHKATLYFLTNGLLMNAEKIECMFIGSHQLIPQLLSNITIEIHNTTIQPNICVKNLGQVHVFFYKHIML